MKNPIEKGFAPIKNGKLYYEKVGKGFPLVFVHGLAADCRMWQAQFEYFSRYFQVIQYDVRGFGKSSEAIPHKGAEDLKELLDFLEIDKIHLMGISMGGNIALNFAEVCPEMLSKLVAVDSDIHGFKGYTEAIEQIFGSVMMAAQTEGIEEAKKLWMKSDLIRPYNPTPETERMKQILDEYSGIHFLNAHLLPNSEPRTISRLHEIQAQTLIIVGEHDIPDFQLMADVLHKEIPHNQKIIIRDAGHTPNLEQTDEFNSIVEAFLLE